MNHSTRDRDDYLRRTIELAYQRDPETVLRHFTTNTDPAVKFIDFAYLAVPRFSLAADILASARNYLLDGERFVPGGSVARWWTISSPSNPENTPSTQNQEGVSRRKTTR